MPQSSPQLATLSSPFLGLGVIASAIGLQTLFSDGLSLEYNFGVAVGQLAGTAVLALPILLVWRYFTKRGRGATLGGAFNIFCALTLLLWLGLFVVAKPLLRNAELPRQPRAAAISQQESTPSRPICKNFFDQYDEGSTCVPAKP